MSQMCECCEERPSTKTICPYWGANYRSCDECNPDDDGGAGGDRRENGDLAGAKEEASGGFMTQDNLDQWVRKGD